jgi:hypothetical protein
MKPITMHKHVYKGTAYDYPIRDNRRLKCYKGERQAFGQEFSVLYKGGDFKATCEYAQYVLRSKTWLRLREDHGQTIAGRCLLQDRPIGFYIKDGRGTSIARGGNGFLNFPRWARTKPVILHEIAHNLVGSRRGHNWPFNRAYIDLVNVFIGKAAGKRLEACLKAAGCKTRPPRILSPERLAQLREQGQRLAATNATKRSK